MKKLSILATMLLGVILLVSCDADRDSNPVVNTDATYAEFKLNDPVQSGQFVDLENNSVKLAWSQPNYGYNSIITYKVQVGLVQDDGSIKWNEKDVTDDDGNVIGTEPEFIINTYNTCEAEVPGKYLAMEINQLDGLEDVEAYKDLGYREVAVRIHAAINITSSQEVKGTGVFSNPVKFKKMRSYAIIKAPAAIYLIGTPNGWTEPSAANEEKLADWALYETEIGNNIFQGEFELEAGNLQFRFYTALTGWEDDSWGTQEDDSGVEAGFVDGKFPNDDYSDGKITKGKGSWLFQNFPGGTVVMTVDMNAATVQFTIKDPE